MRERHPVVAIAGVLAMVVGFSVSTVFADSHPVAVSENRYVTAVVDEINKEDSTVTFLDESGELWVAEADVACFKCGEGYILTLSDMGTSEVYDDEIVDIF